MDYSKLINEEILELGKEEFHFTLDVCASKESLLQSILMQEIMEEIWEEDEDYAE